MIVNPQEFNYRLTIGTLLAAIAFLVVYGFSKYDTVNTENEFLRHEKKLLQSELSEIVNKYDELGLETNSLKSQIDNERQKIEVAQDSLELLKADVALIPQFREEIKFLSRQNEERDPEKFLQEIATLTSEKEEREFRIATLNSELHSVQSNNLRLEAIIANAKLVYANSFEANAYRIKNSGDKLETNKAKHAELFEVCFVLGENPIADAGQRELYVQILGPDNNVVADKGAVSFGDFSLIYSSKLHVNYTNQAEEICIPIENSAAFKKGTYYVSIFENERSLGRTQLDLY